MKKIISTIIVMCLAILVATAQETVHGLVKDDRGVAIALANVVLINASDSTYVQGTVTNEDGSFMLTNAPTNGLLKITMLGYQALFHHYTSAEVGVLTLQSSTQALDEITVTAQRPAYKLTANGLQTNVQGTVLSQLGTANDVLSMIPGLVMNSEGNYEVIGKGEPVYYLNGRKVYDIKQIASLASQEIKEVEVIRNPGAQYAATVKAVVRITTIKKQGDGWGINARVEYVYSKSNQYLVLPSLSWNYRIGRWDFFGTHYYSPFKNHLFSHLEQEIAANVLWHQDMETQESYKDSNLYNTLGANYSIDDNNSVGVKYTLYTTPKSRSDLDMDAVVYADGEYYDNLTSHSSEIETYKPKHLLNAYYNGKVGKLGVDVNVDWMQDARNKQMTTNEVSNTSESRVVTTHSKTNNHLWAGKAVLTYPIWKGQLNVGVEATSTHFNNAYYADVDFLESNDTQLDEWHLAPFAEYQFTCKWGSFSAGLRYEHVAFDYYLDQVKQQEQSRRYDNVFPNISWGHQLGQATLQVGYTMRTQRPSYSALDNNISYLNRYTTTQGNPTLASETHHSFNAALVWKWLQVALSYDNTHNKAMQVAQEIEGTDGALCLSWINWPSAKELSFSIAASGEIGKWSPNLTVAMAHCWLPSGSIELPFKAKQPIFEFRCNNEFTLSHGWRLSLKAALSTKGDYYNYRLLHTGGNVDIGVTKYLLNRSLIVRAMLKDIFSTSQRDALTAQGNATISQQHKNNTRTYIVSVQYLFNTSHSKYKGTGAGNNEKSRL